jgi:hypothetical protein
MRINVKQSVCSKDEFVVFRKRRIARKVKRLAETVREYDSHIYCLCEDGYEGTAYMANTCRIYDRLLARLEHAISTYGRRVDDEVSCDME